MTDYIKALIEQIQNECAGRDRWYVMNAAEDGYCIDFRFQSEADYWMAERLRENPDYIKRNGYHIVKQRHFDIAETFANDAAKALTALQAENDDLRLDAERWRTLLESVITEIEDREYSGAWRGTENAPGHGHEKPGIWDSDNGFKAGKPCAWCATWNAARAALAQTDKEQPC